MQVIDLFSFFVCLFLLFKWRSLSKRLKDCEAELKTLLPKKEVEAPVEFQKRPLSSPPPPPKVVVNSPKHPLPPPPPPISPVRKTQSKQWQKFLFLVKENWLGFFGSAAVVAGGVFFALTSKVMQLPQMRVTALIVFSFVLLAASLKLKKPKWSLLCSWLKAIGGSFILFATLGAGSIPGLCFIQSQTYSFLFLSLGLVLNIVLSLTTPSQVVASFHVILSLLALCLIPQIPILLPVGALVSISGLFSAYRSKWDVHLLFIGMAFAIQNLVWSSSTGMMPWLALICSVGVYGFGAFIHYSKKYKNPKLEPLPLITHIANWGFLSLNIWRYIPLNHWSPLIFGIMALVGFVVARKAKKLGIQWLYMTDTLLAQVVAMVAIASLALVSVNKFDIALLLLLETFLFNYIYNVQKESWLLRFGYCSQLICYFFAFFSLPNTDVNLFKVLGVGLLSWGFYILGTFKGFVVDSLEFILVEMREKKHSPASLMVLMGTGFFLIAYYNFSHSLSMQCLFLTLVIGMHAWRSYREDQGWNIACLITLFTLHVLHIKGDMGIILLDTVLVFANLLNFKLWNQPFHPYLIYAIGFQTIILTATLFRAMHPLIIGPLFLGYSLFVLEVSKFTLSYLRHPPQIKRLISQAFQHIGLAFLAFFLLRFVTVQLQIHSYRLLTEFVGICAIIYWIIFSPKEYVFLKDILIGFVTLCIFVETSEIWRPFVWGLMAIALLLFKSPSRFTLYSWLYLIGSIVHTSFITSVLVMPRLFFLEQYHIPPFAAIISQFGYALLIYRNRNSLKGETPTFMERIMAFQSLSVLLPIFAGIAFLFAYNYEKAILTLLWVGLTSVYLTIGLIIKSKHSIQVSMVTLVLCSLRLIVFDLTQSDFSLRALVFLGVGSCMIGLSVLYKKYKHRIEAHEKI